jgi:protein involved in polysaccharide export with SLBB domain
MHRSTTATEEIRRGRGGSLLSLLALAVALALVAGCGASSRQRQQAMMLAEGDPQTATLGASLGSESAPETQLEDLDQASYRLAPGDLIDVKFPYHPEENERVPVRPDGQISLQVTGDVRAAGLTVKELEDRIVEKATTTLKDPVVSVVIAALAEHKVYVGGDVLKPGYVNFRDGMTPLQAIIERGGFTDTAKADEVLYITRIGDEIQAQRLDLQSVVDGDSSEDIVMAPDDIVFVPKTWIGKADVWVDQWIRGLLPTVPRPGLDLNSLGGF